MSETARFFVGAAIGVAGTLFVGVFVQALPAGAGPTPWYWTLTCETEGCRGRVLDSLTVRAGAGVVDTYGSRYSCEFAACETAIGIYARQHDQYTYSCSQLAYQPQKTPETKP